MWNRRVMRLCLMLIAGAIVNVAVAWGFALFLEADALQPRESAGGFAGTSAGPSCNWDVFTSYRVGAVRLSAYPRGDKSMIPTAYNESRLFPTWSDWLEQLDAIAVSRCGSAAKDATKFMHSSQWFDARGWPMMAMQARWDGGDVERSHRRRWKWGLALSGDVRKIGGGVALENFKVLPFLPIWPGFAINTIFYAGLLWVMFAMPFTIRRRRRIKRGLCPACAYPVGTSEVCTECGGKITHAQPRRGDGL